MNTKIKFIAMLAILIFGIITNAGANISSVDYLHKTILNQKNILVPIGDGVNSESVHSVKYMMTQIDSANKLLNGFASSNYAAGANIGSIVATTKVESAVSELIKKESQGFSLQLTNTDTFVFTISARGNFSIDWGDGVIDKVNKQDVTNTTYTHNYANSGNYTVSISGLATEYSTLGLTAAISFSSSSDSAEKITGISGSLSAIFPTLVNGANPRFASTFNGCTGLTGSIPPDLFSGLSGAPVTSMFRNTFYDCSGLTGEIPPSLFGNISGAPASNMFQSTFNGCSGLRGSIPSGLFGNLSGAPTIHMFSSTFFACTGLTGEIPSGLFGNISGAPASNMFHNTFFGCTGLTGEIPSGLFGNLSGAPAISMFNGTFSDCSGLESFGDGIWDLTSVDNSNVAQLFMDFCSNCSKITSKSPSIAPGSNVKLWQHFTNSSSKAFIGATNLADYADIPAAWK